MRLTDLLHPHLDGVTTVIDAAPHSLRLAPYLHLPDGVVLLDDDGERHMGEGEMVLVPYGPDPALYGTEADCLAVLERLRPGGRGLLLFGHPGPEPPYHRLLDSLVAHRCQVLRAAPLDYAHLHAGAVFVCLGTDELLPTHDWFGRPVPPDGFAATLRLAGEYVLADLVSRSLRARHLDLQRRAQEAEHLRDAAREERLTDRLAAAVQEKEQLAAALRAARERAGALEARVAMLEGSTSLKVGKALVSAARRPRRAAVTLPRELFGLWRGRTAHKPVPASRPAGDGSTAVAADGRLHLVHRAFSCVPRDRLVIAGVLTDRTAGDFAADAIVNRMLPHDAVLLLQRTDPDAVVVQLSACTGDGPWSLLGTGLAPDLDRKLAELLSQARALGRPAVLWRDAPGAAAPGLARLTWDAVLDAGTGVCLSRLDPAEHGRERLREVFQRDSTRVRLAELARLVGAPDPLDQRRVAVLAEPRDRHDVARLVAQVLGQRHRPAEVVVADPAGLEELTGAGVAVRTGLPTAPWTAYWTDPAGERPDTLLLDLMCAQEHSGADALGRAGAAADYTFVPELRWPLLVRSSLHTAGTPPETWCGQGYRLFAVCGKEPS
ncbi:hypothetical protein LK07_29405 [Streptomyces pluripotens]|uniref:Uncharacterized protein n=2 Tax=Streptomyces TaxID=1883 RepID=A0A221P5U7_9ACTN|nr:hypothetical protein LK06_028235 [Streptomyces pluripotens]ASN27466.1 hypothetical protein LK07_29405 [Streptomyces pluripotens]KIE23183.1 hypothetical protein LK08_31170 [Streptomyces sp. MUSC 125]